MGEEFFDASGWPLKTGDIVQVVDKESALNGCWAKVYGVDRTYAYLHFQHGTKVRGMTMGTDSTGWCPLPLPHYQVFVITREQ